MGVQRPRRDRRERARRRIAPLLEHPAAQGPLDLRAGRPRRRRLGELARRLRRPRAALRAARGRCSRVRRTRWSTPPYDRTPKTVALREAAETLGLEWILPKLAITFAPEAGAAPVLGEPVRGEEPNLHGRVRQTCRMCGECNFGCNYGSKYTLDFNYLSFAKLRHGADIRTRSEVKTFAPRPEGGYVIRYVDHSGAVEGEPRTRAAAGARADGGSPHPLGGHVRVDVSPAEEPRQLPRAERAPGHALLRQRRPARLRAEDARDRERRPPRSRDRARVRAGDHEHDPCPGRARGRPRACVLRPGRRLPGHDQLDDGDRRPARRASSARSVS